MIPFEETRIDNYSVIAKENLIGPLTLLAGLTLLKSLIWERGTMQRFVTDYHPSMHSFDNQNSQEDLRDFSHGSHLRPSISGDQDPEIRIEELESAPKIVNLALLQLPFMLFMYYGYFLV